MAEGLKPIRRVVTGNDERGRSKVVWDGPAPNAHPVSMGWGEATPTFGSGMKPRPRFPETAMMETCLTISRARPTADTCASSSLRGVQPITTRRRIPGVVPVHAPKLRPPGRTWDRGGNNAYSSAMHKTETVDYGILLDGERELVLDDRELPMQPGDIVVQVGAWHQWSSPRQGGRMAFDMIAARFVDGPVGLAQGSDAVMRADPGQKLPEGVKPARRIVTIDREPGKSSVVDDGPRPTCAPIRRARASPRRGCGSPIARRRRSFSRRCICRTPSSPRRAAPSSGSSPFRRMQAGKAKWAPPRCRPFSAPWGHRAPPLTRPGRLILTCRRRAPSISAASSKARSCWCSTRRKCP